MYCKAENLNLPDGKRRIWRYMDFANFVNIISTGKLFFCL